MTAQPLDELLNDYRYEVTQGAAVGFSDEADAIRDEIDVRLGYLRAVAENPNDSRALAEVVAYVLDGGEKP